MTLGDVAWPLFGIAPFIWVWFVFRRAKRDDPTGYERRKRAKYSRFPHDPNYKGHDD